MIRPLVRPLTRTTFATAVSALSSERGFVAIDRRGAPPGEPRCSIVASRPASSIAFTGGFVTVDGRTAIDTPRTALAVFLARAAAFERDPYLAFSGGAIGYVGFEGAKVLSGFDPAKGFSRFPQGSFGIYRTAVLFDHVEGTAFVVSAGEDAEHEAEELSQHLEAFSVRAEPVEARAVRPEPVEGKTVVRFLPDDAAFDDLMQSARQWLRAEKLTSVHLTRQALNPSAGTDLVDRFLSETEPDVVRALFTHEGAAAVVSSRAALAPTPGRQADPVQAFLSSLPLSSTAGKPVAAAMAFVTNHEEEHRRFYGGAFGTADAQGFNFQTITRAACDADGAIATTAGLDVTAAMTAGEVRERMDALLAGT